MKESRELAESAEIIRLLEAMLRVSGYPEGMADRMRKQIRENQRGE